MAARNAASVRVRPGRLVKSVGELALPLNMAASVENVNFSASWECTRRPGYKHALRNALTAPVYLAQRFTDVDGTEVYIIIDGAGITRVT